MGFKKNIDKAKSEGIPVFKANKVFSNNLQVEFWCPFCCLYHRHGMAGIEPYKLVHKVAHCHERVEAVAKGYYLFIEESKDKDDE